jgi:hypothetical protein
VAHSLPMVEGEFQLEIEEEFNQAEEDDNNSNSSEDERGVLKKNVLSEQRSTEKHGRIGLQRSHGGASAPPLKEVRSVFLSLYCKWLSC